MQYVILWLEGPLQSWGDSSKYGQRETLPFPTKSGVFGMILAALGAKGSQEELLAQLADFPQKILVFSAPSKMMDFHMIGSGYNVKDPWQRLAVPRKADGGIPNTGGSKMTYRYYVQEARYAVIQGLSKELANQIVAALKHPVYSPSLGRKSCIPTEFIYQGDFASLEEAEKQATNLASDKGLEIHYEVIETATSNLDGILVEDVPLAFGTYKKYKNRRVLINERGKT